MKTRRQDMLLMITCFSWTLTATLLGLLALGGHPGSWPRFWSGLGGTMLVAIVSSALLWRSVHHD